MMQEVRDNHPIHLNATQKLHRLENMILGKEGHEISLKGKTIQSIGKEDNESSRSTSFGGNLENVSAQNSTNIHSQQQSSDRNGIKNSNQAEVFVATVLSGAHDMAKHNANQKVSLPGNQQPLVAPSKLVMEVKPQSWKGSIMEIDINGKLTSNENVQTSRSNVPDGGWGWVVVFASACVTAIVGGSYVAFSLFYVELQESFDTNKAVTGWIGSIYMATGNFLGIFFSVPVRLYGSRPVCIVGAVVTCVGYIVSSYATNIIFLYISFGIVAGAGVGMIALATFVITQIYFDKKRALASGIAISGFSLGMLISGPLIHFLVNQYTWRGALLIIGGIFLHVIVFALFFRPLKSPCDGKVRAIASKSEASYLQSSVKNVVYQLRAVFDFTLLKNLPFCLYLVAQFLGHIGLATFYQHIPSRAIHYGVPRHLVALLPTITGVATGIARILMSFVANAPCTNRMLQYSISLASGGLLQCLIFLATDFISIGVMIALIGILNGGFFCIMTTLLVDLHGVEHVARAQSLMSLALGFSLLIATPFSGFIFDVTNDYNLPFLVTGLIQALGAGSSFASYLLLRHRKHRRSCTSLSTKQ